MQERLEAETRGEDIDLWPFFARLRQRWLYLVILVLTGLVAGFFYARLAPPRFVATTTLIPQLTTVNSQILTTLAETGGTRRRGLGWGPELLYGQILRSDNVLDGVLAHEFARAQAGEPDNLFSVYGVVVQAGSDPATAAGAQAEVKSHLRSEAIHYLRDPLTEFMRLSVSLPAQPEVAARVANQLVKELARYFNELSRQRAEVRQALLTDRMSRISRELAACEDALPGGDSAHQDSDAAALRNVWILLRTQLETMQAQEYEAFKPINVLDSARPPTTPVYKDRRSAMLLGGVVGLLLALVLIQIQPSRPSRSS